MFTTIDIVNKVYSLLHAGGIANLHKTAKPLDKKEDEYTVINTLSITSDELQECPFNVNYHVEDIDVTGRIEDSVKLNSGTKTIIGLLHDYADSDIHLDWLTQTLVAEPDLPEHFVNIRFIARHVN
jgi:hypothetical protein